MKNANFVKSFKYLNKEQRGLTLLTLIVTIVIMLILAGVTLNIAIRR